MFEGRRFTDKQEVNGLFDGIIGVLPDLSLLAVLALTNSSCATAALPPNPTRTPKPTYTAVAIPMTVDSRLKIMTPTVLPSATPTATSTESPVPTPTPTTTSTPEATSTPKFQETATRVVKKTPKSTQTSEPQETVVPEFMFKIVGEPEFAPNCGTVYIEGVVFDKDGNPLNGQIVELSFWSEDNKTYRVTGEGKDTGQFGFSPLSGDQIHSPQPFMLRLVRSEDDPTPISDILELNFTDCDKWGQVTGIVFKGNSSN